MGEQELQLTTKEFDLLRVLVRDAGKVVTREQIMREVWDTNWWGSTKTLDMHISWLRRSSATTPAAPLHHHGAGRRLPVRARRLAPAAAAARDGRGPSREASAPCRARRGPTLEGALMRRRLLLSTLAVAVVAILLLGIPLAYAAHKLVYEEAGRSLDREASSIAGSVGYALEKPQPVTGAIIAREYPGKHISVTLPDGRTLTAKPRRNAAAPSPPPRRTARSASGCRARRRRSATPRCG